MIYNKEKIREKGVEYINNGFSIHFLVEGEKRPFQNNWSTAPFLTTINFVSDINKVRNPNLGVRLGEYTKIKNRYLYVLDVDISSEDINDITEAHDHVRKIYKDYTMLPSVKSATKNSRHYYFLSKVLLKTKKIVSSDKKVTKTIYGESKVKNAWEIDLCSTGKQVVLPPSVYNGAEYQWDKNIFDFINDDKKIADMIIDDVNLLNLIFDEEKDPDIFNTDKEVKKQYTIDDVRKILNNLPSNFLDDYEDWLKVGMALHNEFKDSENEQEALNLYEEFSKKSPKWEKGQTYNKWKSFNDDGGVSLGTLIFHMKKEIQKDPLKHFGDFLNNEKVNFDTLKTKLKEINLKSYELDILNTTIAEKLTESLKYKINTVNSKKIVNNILKEIKEEKEEKITKMAIGLDDTLTNIILNEIFNNKNHLLNLNGNIFKYNNGVWAQYELSMLQKDVLNKIKDILISEEERYTDIKEAIYKSKKNDDLNTLTQNITNLILKMVATSESEDLLNLQNTKEVSHSIINTLNKEIYIKNGKMIVNDHKFDSYLISQYNVHYDDTQDCPTWLMMLNKIFQKKHDKEDVIRHFTEVMGYMLQSKKTEPIFLICIGSGRNGKSFIFNEFTKLMGINSVISTNMCTFESNQHNTAALVGKNMLIDDDWKKNQVLPDDFIKKISEDKLITVNPKFGKPFNIVSRSTPVILANSSPRTKDVSYGIERRAHIFNFDYQIQDDEIDHNLSEKLKLERSGFLNFLIKSFINYQIRGKFIVPLSCKETLNNWLKSSNPLLSFIEDKFIITKDEKDFIKAQKCFDMYKAYTENENHGLSMTRNSFYDDLNNINGIKVKNHTSDNQKVITGIKLRG